MESTQLMIYGLLLLPVVTALFAGYGKLKVGPFFGVVVAMGAVATLLSYLLLDLQAALFQLGALVAGVAVFMLLLGLLGDKYAYRSANIALASVALFPLGVVLASSHTAALLVAGALLLLNFLFCLTLNSMRKNLVARRKNEERPKPRFLLPLPAVLSAVTVGLMVSSKLSEVGVI